MTVLWLGLAAVLGVVLGAAATIGWKRRERAALEEELADARRRLDKARAARERFFDHATHELRSPLAAILGYQELLQDGILGELSAEAVDAVRRIGRSGRHLVGLIDGLVELSRLQSGDIEPDLMEIDPRGTLAALAETFRRLAADRGVAATVELPNDLPPVRTDPERWSRALDLLLTSTVRHPGGDALVFRAHADDGISVEIGPVDMAALATEDDPDHGTGLRLAVVRGTAELLGGALTLHTTGPSAGVAELRIRDL